MDNDLGPILVVEDNDVNRNLIVSILNARDYKTIEAVDGQDALEKMSENPSVILLDQMMEPVDGFTFLEQARAMGKIGHIPVIMVTGDERADLTTRAAELGVQYILSKPIHPEKLLIQVSNALSGGMS